jgi:DNA-binding transcriptional ArsR family regulator
MQQSYMAKVQHWGNMTGSGLTDDVFQVLGNPLRREILCLTMQTERT